MHATAPMRSMLSAVPSAVCLKAAEAEERSAAFVTIQPACGRPAQQAFRTALEIRDRAMHCFLRFSKGPLRGPNLRPPDTGRPGIESTDCQEGP